ncbi:tRNA (N6-isopentenyl adenosine(37)-C2)-methylthiotransferase MiaB [Miltoncostaea marina]|uniref:tRNA (N6-isopentenyl adenosine(37)-C2)-methylthiotransferase MiaB n=1 Tax=Miltoncostaea marina TaxID=2843215 RepID=UPI001C3E64D6|nr:tRNA (N6-isopentenyl adenosine(37)-C2)-methylthiotransferase MiaB [Miltoncostaea marina]
MRYHLTTFGCQMNEHDSERMRGVLEDLGYSRVDARDEADLILFNTCTIRGSADERFLGNLGDAKRVKRERPDALVAVGGCWAQSMKEQVFREFPFVDIAFGPSEVARLGELVARERIDAVGAFSFDGAFSGSLPARRERAHQAWVQISVGCNCVCAYCIVPSVRGRERSRPLADVVGEVRALAADGVVEVTLLGQNVNSYGRDLPREERATFAELLRAVAGVEGIARVRYTSPHPKDMKADVIAAMAECPEVCEHLHLPAQSGSTRILKAMRRTYSRERYLDLVARLRGAIPDLSLTTDLIVGFPGETEADFEDTLRLVEECRYDGAYTFLYSPRPGTEAAERLPDDVPAEVKRERIGRLVEVVQRTAAERAARFVGTTGEVLVEGPSRTDPSKLRGRLRQNITVNFTGTAAPGSLVRVAIEGATSTTLSGRQAGAPAPADLVPA